MRLSQLVLYVAPLIAVATAAVPNAAGFSNLVKRDPAPQCSKKPAEDCDPSVPGECCDSECIERSFGTTCGGCLFPLDTPCFVSIEGACCQGKCVPNPSESQDSDLGICQISE
ncbi:hypothetical protein V8B97DRAFT_970763 [Scleroderma yunnanense]